MKKTALSFQDFLFSGAASGKLPLQILYKGASDINFNTSVEAELMCFNIRQAHLVTLVALFSVIELFAQLAELVDEQQLKF